MERTFMHHADPYSEQLRHLRAVVERRETPVCSGQDGLKTLQATGVPRWRQPRAARQ